MKIKTNAKVNFIKTFKKTTQSTQKQHCYIKVMDVEHEVHNFYLKPALIEKVENLKFEDELELDLIITYGTKDKKYDGIQLLNINPVF